jgi:hypothetical protein
MSEEGVCGRRRVSLKKIEKGVRQRDGQKPVTVATPSGGRRLLVDRFK